MAARSRHRKSHRLSETDEEDKENEYGRRASKVAQSPKQVDDDAKRTLRPRGSINYALSRVYTWGSGESSGEGSDVDCRGSDNDVKRVPRQSHSSEAECSYDDDDGNINDYDDDERGEKERVESEDERGEVEGEESEEDTDNKKAEEERCTRKKRTNIPLRLKQTSGKFRHRAEEQAEKYFSSQRRSKGGSSGRSLSKLDSSMVSDMLDAVHNPYRDSIDELHKMYRDLYQYWLFQISQGFNVLLYGVGSKQKVLEGFRIAHLMGTYHLVIDGCHPEVTFKNVLSKILSEVLEYTNRIGSPILQCQHICETLCEDDDCPCSELFLVIHNIDGHSLHDIATQNALSLLAQCPHVHIIATCNHIHTPMLWDEFLQARFQWAWHDTTTFEHYHEEVKYEEVQMVSGERSKTLTLAAVTYVVNNLTPNARGIFEVLARHLLDHEDDSYKGLDFMDLYRMCRSKFLVNSDTALKTQLTEFQDHKLIHYVKSSQGALMVVVCVDPPIVKEFIDKECSTST